MFYDYLTDIGKITCFFRRLIEIWLSG